MNRLAILCAAMASFSMTACASGPQAANSPPAKHVVTPPGGVWEVTEATAIGPTASGQSPYLGQKLALYQASAGDPAGRSCSQPAYMGWQGRAADVVGKVTSGDVVGKVTSGDVVGKAAPGDVMTPVMDISCDGQPFGTYVAMADGRLMTRVNDWVLSLRRLPVDAMDKPAAPLSMPMPVPVPEPAKTEPVKSETLAPKAAPVAESPHKPEPSKPAQVNSASAKRTMVYLASYKNEKTAQSGWQTLAKKSPLLAKQQPVINKVDLGTKGEWFRLYGQAADEAERQTICTQLDKMVDECGSRRRE